MNSILKLLEYVRKVSTVEIECDGEKLMTPTSVSIRPSFFLKDDCKVCGICCSAAFNTVYTDSGISHIKNCPESEFTNKSMYGDNPIPITNREKLLDSIISHSYIVNGEEVTIYESPCLPPGEQNKITLPTKPSASARCRWMIDDVPGLFRCGIHPIRSVTCGLPHCRFNFNNKTRKTSIGVGQYGRNWALGCPIDLKTAPFDVNSVKTRLHWLKVLKLCADDLKIPTVLPFIIDYLEEHMSEYEAGIFPDYSITFNMNGEIVEDGRSSSSAEDERPKLFNVRKSR